jgi:hypothetical protein
MSRPTTDIVMSHLAELTDIAGFRDRSAPGWRTLPTDQLVEALCWLLRVDADGRSPAVAALIDVVSGTLESNQTRGIPHGSVRSRVSLPG